MKTRRSILSVLTVATAALIISGCGGSADDAATTNAAEPTATTAGADPAAAGVFKLTAGATTTHLVTCPSPDERVSKVEFTLSGSAVGPTEVTPLLREAHGDGGVVVKGDSSLPEGATVSLDPTCEPWDHQGVKGPLARDSFWSTPLEANAPIDTQSGALVDELNRQVRDFGPWINYDAWSIPVYTVPEDQELVDVVHDNEFHDDFKAVLSLGVPIPPEAVPAKGTDRHLVIWQPSTDRMWEFWAMRRENGTWTAGHGGFFDRVSEHDGAFPTGPNWGATATGLAAVGGLITLDDLRQGSIDHVVALAMPDNTEGKWVLPAQRSDGTEKDNIVPQGIRFRLDPTVDVDSLNIPPVAKMIARAAQSYGMVVRDNSDTVSFYAETPKNEEDSAVYIEAMQGQFPDSVLADFPWDKLQALELGERLTWPE